MRRNKERSKVSFRASAPSWLDQYFYNRKERKMSIALGALTPLRLEISFILIRVDLCAFVVQQFAFFVLFAVKLLFRG